MINSSLLEKLTQLEQLLEQYQVEANKLTIKAHQEQVQQQVTLLNNTRTQLQHVLKKQTTSSSAAIETALEEAAQLSEEELTAKLQETWPDFLPTTMEVVENCYLTVYNLGMLTYQEGGTALDTVYFTINEQSIENLSAQRSSKGTLVIYSNWRFYQKNDSIGLHSYSNSTSHSIKNYKITCQFEVDAAGEVNLYKDTVLRTTEEDAARADLLFITRAIEVDLDNADRLSISGGTTPNTMSVVPEKVKNWLKSKIVGKEELTKTFSLKLAAKTAPEEQASSVEPVEKELVFEKENQAVLSSDQLSVLIKWWDSTKSATKLKINNRELYIEITGYTSTTGDNNYNYELGKDRARDVGEKLSGIIGEALDGTPVADIRISSFGEETEDTHKYVKINILNK